MLLRSVLRSFKTWFGVHRSRRECDANGTESELYFYRSGIEIPPSLGTSSLPSTLGKHQQQCRGWELWREVATEWSFIQTSSWGFESIVCEFTTSYE
jgi:hypothetical protein